MSTKILKSPAGDESPADEAIWAEIDARHRADIYKSPFASFYHQFTEDDAIRSIMEYRGEFSALLGELEIALRYPNEDLSQIRMALHPPRLIRGVIDYAIAHPEADLHGLVNEVIHLGLAVYTGVDAAEAIKYFRSKVFHVHPELLATQVYQPFDLPTWDSTDPSLSYKTARDMVFACTGVDLFFIALGHGGVAAGLDVFLRYLAITESNSQMYVVRFSRNPKKHGDVKPRVSEAEVEYLKTMVAGRQVVMFDEDRATNGGTLDQAVSYFEGRFGVRITSYCNNGFGNWSPNKINPKMEQEKPSNPFEDDVHYPEKLNNEGLSSPNSHFELENPKYPSSLHNTHKNKS